MKKTESLGTCKSWGACHVCRLMVVHCNVWCLCCAFSVWMFCLQHGSRVRHGQSVCMHEQGFWECLARFVVVVYGFLRVCRHCQVLFFIVFHRVVFWGMGRLWTGWLSFVECTSRQRWFCFGTLANVAWFAFCCCKDWHTWKLKSKSEECKGLTETK